MGRTWLKIRNRYPAMLTTIALAGLVALVVASTFAVPAQSEDPPWKTPVQGLAVLAGDEADELLVTYTPHPEGATDYRVSWVPEGE